VNIHKLTATKVDRLIQGRKLGKHSDGGGLYLRIEEGAASSLLASWVFRFQRNGRETQYGLGIAQTIDLETAREKARQARVALDAGRDPRGGSTAGGTGKTFAECAREWLPKYRADLSGAKGARDLEIAFETYVYPVLGSVPVDAINHNLILQVVEPIWLTRRKLAPALRGKIEKILDYAKTRGYRTGDNPASWSLLSTVLPSASYVPKNHAALPDADLPAFMIELRKQEGVAARALEFSILTACRTGDIKGGDQSDAEPRPPLQWSHIDFESRTWSIPVTKNGLKHRIPLSDRAIAILKEMRGYGLDDQLVFPSLDNPGRPMCHRAMPAVLKRMGLGGKVTVHGFRATFKTWAETKPKFHERVVEAALAHTPEKLRQAYFRNDHFDDRVQLMTAWAAYAAGGAQIIPFRSAEVA
jgi:integrase